MEDEIQQPKDLLLQCKADNERLCPKQAAFQAGFSVPTHSSEPVANVPPGPTSATVVEWLVVVHRDVSHV